MPILRSPETEAAVKAQFNPEQEELLNEIQHGCFLFFWKDVGNPSGLAKDRHKGPVSSVAAVGFQLSSLPIGVERGWITREEGERRARQVLKCLLDRTDNKRAGVYLHYVDLDTGGLSDTGYEVLASTVDTALLIAGAIPAGEYFGGEVKTLVDRLVAGANWRFFATGDNGRLSMGWEPDDRRRMDGPGKFHHLQWGLASDEERLIYFVAVGSPVTEHAVDPRVYMGLDRVIKRWNDLPPHAVSFQGTLFHFFFSHCWIDYRSLPADDPSAFGIDAPRIDWFENSRRAVLTHRRRCLEQRGRFKSVTDRIWGFSACAGRDGYLVPEIRPNVIDKDNWYDGTVAPYAAGASIMFAPAEAMDALQAIRSLKGPDGRPFVWRDPAEGGYGLVDCFNLDQNFASDDYVGIDHGPMLLAIENARTGLIGKLFMQSDTAKRAVARLYPAR